MKHDCSDEAREKIKQEKKKEDKMVDEASKESFPASDPPAWTAGIEKDKKK